MPMTSDEESPIKYETKSLRKLAAAALWFAAAAPLHAAVPAQTLGFTEANRKPLFIARKDLLPDAAGGGGELLATDGALAEIARMAPGIVIPGAGAASRAKLKGVFMQFASPGARGCGAECPQQLRGQGRGRAGIADIRRGRLE